MRDAPWRTEAEVNYGTVHRRRTRSRSGIAGGLATRGTRGTADVTGHATELSVTSPANHHIALARLVLLGRLTIACQQYLGTALGQSSTVLGIYQILFGCNPGRWLSLHAARLYFCTAQEPHLLVVYHLLSLSSDI